MDFAINKCSSIPIYIYCRFLSIIVHSSAVIHFSLLVKQTVSRPARVEMRTSPFREHVLQKANILALVYIFRQFGRIVFNKQIYKTFFIQQLFFSTISLCPFRILLSFPPSSFRSRPPLPSATLQQGGNFAHLPMFFRYSSDVLPIILPL